MRANPQDETEIQRGTRSRPRAVLIAGPTSSGKSELALALAEESGGIVINADSMQVYGELRILTSRPSPEEEARAPHRLYGFRGAAEPYSVGLWLKDAAAAIAEAEAEERLPIIVGGTGLYFSALLEGLSETLPIPEEVRDHWRKEGRTRSAPELHALLSARDPLTASRLRPTDRQRLVRALEVLDATGRGLACWQSGKRAGLLGEAETLKFVLAPEREALYRRCDSRFEGMLEAGALDEVARIASLGLPVDLPAMRAVGLPPLLAHLAGDLSLEQAAELAKRDTRRYAKRQMTWARSRMISWVSINTQQMKRTKQEAKALMMRSLTLPS
jgi:tRNA dimethylallyltransferase